MEIVLYHINKSFQSPFATLLAPVYQYGGYFGNYIFFMISGLLTARHFKKKICSKKLCFKPYICKRILKLYPLYFLSNLSMVLLLLLKGNIESLNIRKLLSTFFMVSNGWISQDTPYNLPTWFVCVLLICYIIYYFIAKLSARFPTLYFSLCMFLVIWGAALELTAWDFPFHYRTNGEGYMNFFIGALLAEIIDKPYIKRIHMRIFNVISLTLLCFLLISFDIRWSITLICANLILMAIYWTNMINLLACSSIQKIGKCSLSIFMWHIPVVHWLLYSENIVGLPNINPIINLIVYFALLFAMSFFSHHYLEKET